MKQLSTIQLKFILHYVEYGNATQAYLQATPNPITYASAKQQGYMMLKDPEVIEAIEQKKEELSLQASISKEKMVRELTFTAEQAKNVGDFKAYANMKNMIIKMFGYYEPEKIQHSGEQNITLIKINEVKKEDNTDPGQ